MNTWDAFTIIGTISFAMQGSLIGMEKKYDLFAVYFLGLMTAFGGGALQNVLIGGSDYQLWNQKEPFLIAVISITIILTFPKPVLKMRILWANILDAFGIVAFAMQGSIDAIDLGLPASAIVVSAMITATGGGIIRDLLVQRKPIILTEGVYVLWIFLIGLIMAFKGPEAINYRYLIFILFSALRIFSFVYDWKIPYRDY